MKIWLWLRVRYSSKLFKATVRAYYEKALALVKSRPRPRPTATTTSTHRRRAAARQLAANPLRAGRGEFEFHTQIGHPLGVPDFAYAGEIALGVVLNDPSGHLNALHRQTEHYPPALTDALVERLWEADFLLGGLRKSVRRADPVWATGCLFQVVMLCVHALHGRAGRWLINEKGAVPATERLETAPGTFAADARELLGHAGLTVDELARAVDAAQLLVDATRIACQSHSRDRRMINGGGEWDSRAVVGKNQTRARHAGRR